MLFAFKKNIFYFIFDTLAHLVLKKITYFLLFAASPSQKRKVFFFFINYLFEKQEDKEALFLFIKM